ncbi:hypothetical protein GGI25_005271 [Coemansia spiralis]|uniref:Elongation of fatty acids protein n=2 Tax=Coemansia TaxID=4863 RepID=A0A9W8KVV6_9FUNG|nr:hypothetical protein EDC05_005280 [Coemansia umbellata]KAJ2672031.1 hypothetical protein GGI25_005271 [Coemansia spiralis]
MQANPQKTQGAKQEPPKRAQSVAFKRLVIAHNIALAVFSLWTLVSMSSGVISNISSLGWYEGLCDRKFSLWNDKLFRFSYYFYLSKYYEFVDTLIILYKGRRASTLQMYHHAGAVITMWSGCYYLAVPIAFFVIVNSAIHTWMYTFYALTAAGIRPPGKRLLTSSQIFQLIFGISCCLFYVFCPGCQSDRQKVAIYINLAYLFPLLGLFVSFFIRTYVSDNSATSVAKKYTKRD